MDLIEVLDLHWSDHVLQSNIQMNSAITNALHRLNESESIDVEIRQNGKLITLSEAIEGQEASIFIAPPRGSSLFLAKNQDDLLKVFNLHCLPENFALMDSGYRTWAVSAEKAGPPVMVASKFIKKLENKEIIGKTGNRFLIITHDQKIYMTHDISAEIIKSAAQSISQGLAKLEEILADTLHSTEKKRIIRNSLIASLKSCDESNRLKHLLRHCDEILETAQNNYELFISSFSFNSDLDKLHEQKREFSVKLNSLLIGIQGKLLAIPVSTILATTQLKSPEEPDQVTINLAVASSSLIFFIIITWLIRSQIIAINSIKIEVQQKEKRFRLELPGLFKEVEFIFKSLLSDCNLNLKMAKSLIFLSTALTALTAYVFWIKTPLIAIWVNPLLILMDLHQPWILLALSLFSALLTTDLNLIKLQARETWNSNIIRKPKA